jgi:hypothetical protein
MNKKLAGLAARRSRLVAQAAAQRTALGHDLQPWRARLAVVDRGVAIVRYARSHPALMTSAVLLFAALRIRRVGKWLQIGWGAWQVGRGLRRG